MASWAGRSPGSIRSRSITTDVSMIPRSCRCSATRSWVLVEQSVDVGPEAPELHPRCARKDGYTSVGRNELALPERRQLTNRHAVAGDDEGLSAVECPHDLSTLVAKFPLGDLAPHGRSVAHVLRGDYSPRSCS